ncbi:MAG: tRNA preQ1(34) S-adenosylmethionine ribosyltransferase-isomerase QueA [Leptonema sp. (in: bacteria)]
MKSRFFLYEYLRDYYFDLDESLIAKYPLEKRDCSNLMILKENHILIDRFYNIINYLPKDSILVFNNTKVSFRRVFLRKSNSDKELEVLFLENQYNVWKTLIRKGKKIKNKEILVLENYTFVLEKKEEEFYFLSCWKNGNPYLTKKEESENFFNTYGKPPLPPYIKRKPEEKDKENYQTIFAEKSGSVAAPTASLHFTKDLLQKIQNNFKVVFLNLEIGYGTFAPLKEKNFINNELHSEYYEIPEETSKILNMSFLKNPIVAVGTTVLRALEDNFRKYRFFKSGSFSTKIFIKPPDVIDSVDYLITNFHLPASSLFLLVCAFGGVEKVKEAYQIAIEKKFRFFSYGDAMFLQNKNRKIIN